mgnify:CR=1 FL=1
MGRARTPSKARWSSVNFRQGRVANINVNLRKTQMTKPMMDLKELVEKSADANLLRDMIGFAAERLMELEVGAKTGADYH